MSIFAILASLALAAAAWCIYQLMMQVGKLQLRLDALEKRLYSQGLLTGELDGVSGGKPLGSVLHDFELPALAGGTLTLSHWRGRKIVLIFLSPSCEFSRALLPDLAELASAGDAATPVIVSTGDADENRRMFEAHGVRHPVLLQREAEVASLYWVNTTPAAYLVDGNGVTTSILYTGADAVLAAARGNPGSGAAALAGGRGFSRSLTETRVLRDGLKAGTRAPAFTLPLAGGGEASLESYLGRRALLIFSDLQCQPCNALAPRLEQLYRSKRPFEMLLISRGEAEANLCWIAEQGLTLPVALQRHWEISRAYGILAAPVAYAIDEQGFLAADAAIGSEAVLKLAEQAGVRTKPQTAPAARAGSRQTTMED